MAGVMSVKMDGDVYACPVEMIWTPEELDNEAKRKCEACGKICMEVFMRVFSLHEVKNYCTSECYDIS